MAGGGNVEDWVELPDIFTGNLHGPLHDSGGIFHADRDNFLTAFLPNADQLHGCGTLSGDGLIEPSQQSGFHWNGLQYMLKGKNSLVIAGSICLGEPIRHFFQKWMGKH